MIEVVECPICQSTNFNPYLSLQDHSISKETFSIKQCSSCFLRITSPRPSDSDLPKYYESEDYVSHSDSNKGIINSIYQMVKKITIRKKVRLISSVSMGRKLLDIGCGTGDFLSSCKKNKWEVFGFEPDEKARKKAKEKGLETIQDIHLLFEEKANTYDVITMWHVLEHVSDLNGYFKQLFTILKEDGRLIIAVPNPESPDAKHYKSYWAAYDVPRHLFHFSKENIMDLGAKYNFKIEAIKPMVFDSYYVSMLSEKYKGGTFFNAIINGLISNIKAFKNINNSSLIYILSKNTK